MRLSTDCTYTPHGPPPNVTSLTSFTPAAYCCSCRAQVFVTSTARCLDLATALVLPSSVMLLLDSLEGKDAIRGRLDKYIFPADKVTVRTYGGYQ